MKRDSRSRLGLVLIAGVSTCLPLLIGQGCPIESGRPSPGDYLPVVRVVAPAVNRLSVAGDNITVMYDALNPVFGASGSLRVWGFWDTDGIYNGNETTFATSLPSGEGKIASLSTSGMSPGTIYVGIAAENAAGLTTAYAPGRVTLAATAAVTFHYPQENVTVGAGATIPISFTAGTGVTSFTWSLFYDTDEVFNGDEPVIDTGANTTSSVVEREWAISIDMQPGTYYIGARVVTPDLAENIGYADGLVIITAGPFLQILRPVPGDTHAIGTPIPIVFAAGNPQGGDPTIRLFVDPDADPLNGNSTDIATVAASTGGFVWRSTTDFNPGDYYIGAEMIGAVPPLFDFSGPILLLGAGEYMGGGGGGGAGSSLLLSIRSPARDEIRFSGERYTIRWTTNLTIGQGTIEVFREPDVNDDGVPDGADRRVPLSPPGLDASTMTLDFDTTGIAGKYFIGGTVTPEGGESVTAYSKGTLTILPSSFWVGDLRSLKVDEQPSVQSRYFKGAVFRGFNIGDNLGSSMAVGDDFDGDGVQEIILVAQFGKPWFLNQGGRGAGEAYMIYGTAGRRYLGNYDVNSTGSQRLPGTIFTGIVPNPNNPNTPKGYTGTTVAYTVDGEPAPPHTSEGLQSVILIPDQDNDGKKELVFAFPFCNSYSLRYQAIDGIHPAPPRDIGRLEENGHFLRGGLVIVSSTNSLLNSRTALSRHFDRTLMLQEVGQVFSNMSVWDFPVNHFGIPAMEDFCPYCEDPDLPRDGIVDIAFFPGEGFNQDTLTDTTFPIFGLGVSSEGRGIDPPRLATPEPVLGEFNTEEYALEIRFGQTLSLSQIDPPPGPGSGYFVGGRMLTYCQTTNFDDLGRPIHPFGLFPPTGYMRVLGTGFYYDSLPMLPRDGPQPVQCGAIFWGQYLDYCPPDRFADALEPYGCRILGQTTTQLFTNPPTTANLFGHSVSVSGDFLMIGAPLRTAKKLDVTALRNDPFAGDRPDSGTVYMLQLKRPGVPDYKYLWNSMGYTSTDDNGNVTYSDDSTAPAPHNYIIQDVGYSRCWGGTSSKYLDPGDVAFEMSRPFHIVGQAGDRIGDVTGLLDIDDDGVDDFAVGGAGTHGDRGAVYVIYRRQPEIEADYLLERIQLDPSNLNRLNGLMILGRPGERLGTAIAGVGPRPTELKDDYNADGYPDVLIGSPKVASGGRFEAGEAFILFGGEKLLSPAGGATIPQLRDQGHGMVLAGAQAYGHAGTTVASAGDINRDGIADMLIAAPDASPMFDSDGDGRVDTIGMDLDGDRMPDDLNGDGTPDDMTGAGLVYVVFGGRHLTGTIGLDQIGTENLPGFVIVGRKAGDHLGGGLTQNGLLSRGLSSAGDLDGDGFDDLMVSSVLADPDGKTDAGEVYVIYGFSTPIRPRNN